MPTKKAADIKKQQTTKGRANNALLPAGLLNTNNTGIIKSADKQFCKLTGYSIHELNETGFVQLLVKEEQDSFKKTLKKVAASDAAIPQSCTILTKQKKTLPTHATISSLQLADGSVTITIILYKKKPAIISPAATKNKAVQSFNEKRFTTLIENAADAFAILDSKGNATYVSPSLTNVLGYTEKEALSLNLFELIHPEDIAPVSNKMEECLRKPGIPMQGYTGRIRHKDGSWRWLEATLTNMLHNPDINGIIDNFRDVTFRIEAEKQLQQSEEKYRKLFETSLQPIWIYKLDNFNMLDVNAAALQHYGYTRAEFLSLTLKDLLPPGQLIQLLKTHHKITEAENQVRLGVFTHQDKAGKPMSMDVAASKIVYHNADCAIMVCDDVTEKENFLKAIKHSEQKLKTATQIAKLGYWSLNPANNQLSWSEEVYSIWGRNPKNFPVDYDAFFNSIHPADRKRFAKKQSEALSGTTALNFSHRILLPDGSIKWVHELGRLVKDDSGNVIAFEGTVQDITDDKNEEIRLRLMENVILSTNDAVLITEAEPQDEPGPAIVYVNNAFTTITGYTAEEVVGKTPRILQGPKTDKAALKKLGKALRRWEPCEATLINYKKNGEEFWINLSINPIADENGWYTHWIAIERDVTIQQNEALQKQLLADISTLFNKSGNVLEALGNTMQQLLHFSGCRICETWLLNTEQDEIHLVAWRSGNEQANFYDAAHTIQKFSLGEGLPGIVWQNKEITIWHNLHSQPSFARKEAALQNNIKCIAGIPLLHNDTMIGVLVLGSDEESIQFNFHKKLFEALQHFLGAAINRKQTEDQLEQLFAFSPVLICIAATDNSLKKVNPAFTRLLGYTQEELLALKLTDLLHSADKQQLLSSSTVTPDAILTGEKMLRAKDGRYKRIAWSRTEVQSKTEAIFGYGEDITETHELKALLDKSNKLAQIGSWEINLEKNTVYFSDITRAILEVDESFVPDMDNSFSFYKEGRSKEIGIKVFEEAIATGKSWDEELEIITAKGNSKWIREIGEIEIVEGKPTLVYGSAQDITSRKIAEIRLNRTANNIPGVLFQYILYPDGTDKIFNLTSAAIDIWQYSAEACMQDINLIWQQTLNGGDYPKVQTSIQQSMQTLERWHCQYRSLRPDGKFIWLEGFGTPQKMADGSILWDSLVIDITEKKELELQVEQILDSISDAFFALDNNWCFTYCNSEAEKLFQKDATELLGRNMWQLFPEIKNTIQEEVYQKVAATGKNESAEFLYPAHNIWYEINVYPFHNGISVYFRNIEENKKAEAALQDSLEERNSILESIGDGFCSIAKDWTVTYWNRQAEDIIGIKREDITGKMLWDVFADAVDSNFYKYYNEAMNTGRQVMFEEYYPTVNKWFEINVYPSEKGISIFFKDVSIRRHADELVRQSNDRFEKATQATSDAIWDWNMEKDTLYWGGGFKTIFGFDADEQTPTMETWAMHIHPDDLEQVEQSLNEAVADSNTTHWQAEYRYLRGDNTYAFVIDRGIITRNAAGKAIQMVGAITDITPQKSYEDSLKQLNTALSQRARELALSNAELEQFAYIASHDLQEPLRTISSFLTQLEKKYAEALDDKGKKYIHYAVDGARRMRQIVLDLLEFSRVGRWEKEATTINLTALVNDVAAMYVKEEDSAIIEISNLPTIVSYETPLRQLFQNLIGNALKYKKEGITPEIRINSKEKETHWQFSVEDNGIGIEPEYFEKIFIIFQRLHPRDSYSGSGMGLAICKKIIDTLGGEIWVESTPGKGSSFFFTILKKIETP
ncbi:MAG TPA: PAS domain S-box protein [Ferruginibacter sp.]|nr:PAS domain S-box protein [Ferruginibacter sp.]HMP22150.1 PAS domain S-box protein [Ferruginibacter sp.]